MSNREQNETSTSSQSTVIQVDRVSVCFRIPHEQYSGLKEYAIRWLQRRVQYTDLWSLREVSVGVGNSEIIGIIGRNGAGKSTLLKVIAGVLHPTEGRVQVRGTVAPLLGLGAGFHPELTGRENVYLYGALLGYGRREMRKYFDGIVEFAEIQGFIDSPLRTYSGGMSLRLGFAVATCRFADVLLVDEVLAVGDTQFQSKCLQRMESFREQGASIVYVSHNLGSIENLCNRVIWLEQGRIVGEGRGGDIIPQYVSFLSDGRDPDAAGSESLDGGRQ